MHDYKTRKKPPRAGLQRGARATAIASLMAMAASAATTPAHALDEKIFPGSACSPANGSFEELTFDTGAAKDARSAAEGQSIVPRSLVCPLLRDAPGTPWRRLYVRLRKATTAHPVSCTALVRGRFGEPGVSVSAQLAASVTGLHSLWIPRPSGPVPDGPMVVRCELPGIDPAGPGIFTAINSIRLTEYDQ